MAEHMTAEQLRAELGAAAEQWKREAADAERSNDADVWMLCLRAAGQLAEVSARLSGMAAGQTEVIGYAMWHPEDGYRREFGRITLSDDPVRGLTGPKCVAVPVYASPEPPHV